jgi:FAD/FMN-containing dehydrogenase
VLGADESLHHLHAYGTTGIVTGARVALRPARRWTALLASFGDFTEAAETGLTIADLDPVPRNLSVDDAALVALLPEHPGMPSGRVSLRAIVDESTVEAAARQVTSGGGRVELVGRSAVTMLVGLSFNHVTLRAKRNDPSICHLQVGGRPLVDDPATARAVLPHGMLHLDAMTVEGKRGYGGLLLSSYVDRATLWSGVEALRAMDVRVTDAHTWAVGGHGDLAPTIAAAERMDPRGLLNPGKLDRAA